VKPHIDIKEQLQQVANLLVSVTPEAISRAEAALSDVAHTLRLWSEGDSTAGIWPVRELAVCREMVDVANQHWESTRAALHSQAIPASKQDWIA
jgi:hypothetical protein